MWDTTILSSQYERTFNKRKRVYLLLLLLLLLYSITGTVRSWVLYIFLKWATRPTHLLAILFFRWGRGRVIVNLLVGCECMRRNVCFIIDPVRNGTWMTNCFTRIDSVSLMERVALMHQDLLER